MKETFYFSHDYNVRSDDKIKRLIRKHGMVGYGLFWVIVEDLYNNCNALQTDYEGIAYDMRVDVEVVKSVINDFDLFVIEDGSFGSMSVQSRLDERANRSKKARESANKRWGKEDSETKTHSEGNANAMQTHSEGNAIKERKGKEIKGKESKEIPLFEDFKKYALSKEPQVDLKALNLKYDAWIENGWKDGHDNVIKNWKVKLINTIVHLPKKQKTKWISPI